MGKYREFKGVWMVREWGNFLVVGSSMGEIWKEWGNVLGCEGSKERYGKMCCVGSVLGCGKVWGGVGMGSRCVKVCLGCGKRCGKGVGVGAKGVELGLGKGRWGCGEVLGEMWDNPGGWGEGWCHDLGPQLS